MIQPKIHDHLSEVKASPTLLINEASKKMVAAGKDVVQFGFGQSPFPVPDLLVDALRLNAFQKDYLPVKGLLALREAIAVHISKLTNLTYRSDQIIVGPGSKELIHLIQMSLDGDLLLPSPSWVSYAPQAEMNKKKIHWIDTRPGWKLTADQLDQYCSTHSPQRPLLILNYPNNPTGLSHSREELVELAIICRKHQILVLSDEIYGLLDFNGEYRSLATYYPEGTIISTGLSKWCGAGGWRFGWIAVPQNLSVLTATIANLASETYSAVNAPLQYAAIQAYKEHPALEAYLKAARQILGLLSAKCCTRLNGAGIRTETAQGGFYLFPDFSQFSESLNQAGIDTSEKLCSHLLNKYEVAILPGSAFGRPENELTARVAFVDFYGQVAMDQLNANGRITNEDMITLFPQIWKGIERLTSFTTEHNSLYTKTIKHEIQNLPV